MAYKECSPGSSPKHFSTEIWHCQLYVRTSGQQERLQQFEDGELRYLTF